MWKRKKTTRSSEPVPEKRMAVIYADAGVRQFFADMLRMLNYSVVVFPDAKGVSRAVKEAGFDLIFVDFNLMHEGMNSLEFARYLLEHSGNHRLHIVLVIGGEQEVPERKLGKGITVLKKPVSYQDLNAAIPPHHK